MILLSSDRCALCTGAAILVIGAVILLFIFLLLMQNVIVDERSSFAVANPIPGPLASLLRSIKKVFIFRFNSLPPS